MPARENICFENEIQDWPYLVKKEKSQSNGLTNMYHRLKIIQIMANLHVEMD